MFVGHKKQIDFLKKAFQSENLSHGYLFSGQEGLGKKSLALKIISKIFYEEENLERHPDFILIENKGKEIQILQIREMIRKISLKPAMASKKVVIIDNAHLMNKEAQTCLLKTLEEPKGDCVLILISDKPGYLLPTIISRLQVIKFNIVKNKEIEKLLLTKGILKKQAEEISEISLGRPGKAMNLIFDKLKMDNFKQRSEEFDKILKSSLFFRFEYVKKVVENTEEIINILDVWLYSCRQKFLKNPQIKMKKIINLIETTKNLIINTNINSKLALERLVLEI